MHRSSLLLLTALLLTSASAGAAEAATVRAGTWGGGHAVLEISKTGGSIQFDCAHGAIAGEIVVDARGRFRTPGELVREHGGPIRRDEAENREAVVYSGEVRGGKMSLSVERANGGAPIGRYDLELGNPGRVVRCR